MRTVCVTRYVTPLREGGSLPALVEADDDGSYVLKFRGAGQGAKALVAELVVGELARAAGLPVPEIVFAELDPVLADAEPDPEIQDLIRASPGINLALDFLPGSLPFDAAAGAALDPALAASVVWLDALTLNIDRTPRNPNLLLWHRRLWLIDHGAALFPQHSGAPLAEQASRSFAPIAEHVLLPSAGSIERVDAALAARLDEATVRSVTDRIPPAWLEGSANGPDAYAAFLLARLDAPRAFAQEAERARAARA
jgi:hypothetical protein